MLVYYLILVLILGLAYPLCIYKPSKVKNIVYLSVVFIYLFLLSTLRYGIGNDYFSYIEIFERIFLSENIKGLFKIKFEPGFLLVTKLFTMITMNTTALYAIFSVIILTPVAFIIYKYSKNIWLSCYLYICLTFFYTTMNFIRQSVAASIILLGYKFFKEKKTIPFILMVLLATSFHYTSLIMLPIYLLSLIKPNKYLYLGYSVLTVIGYMLSDKILNLVFTYGPKRYKFYAGSFYITSGLSFVFTVIPILLLILFLYCFFFTKWGKESKNAPLFTNLVFLNAVIWLFITKHFILERFSMYVYIFIILALPDISEFFNKAKTLKTEMSDLKKNKNSKAKFNETKRKYIDARYTYMIILSIIMIPSFIYNIFGMNDGKNGFHGIFPYQSGINSVQSSKYNYSTKQELNSSLTDENDLYKYLLKLSKAEDYIVIISNNGYVSALSSDITSALKELGFEGKLTSDKFNYSYIGIAYNNECVYEECSDTLISYDADVCGNEISVSSSGGYTASNSTIKINEKICSLSYRGLNIAVYDTQTNEKIDCAVFSPHTKSVKR